MSSQSLEQEALDRVARMYSSFDRPRRQPPINNSRHPEQPQPEPPKPDPPEPPKSPEPVEEHKPTGLLDVLMKDKEQSLIMLLLVILMKDGAEMNTILALMYLLI